MRKQIDSIVFGMPTLMELPSLSSCVALCRELGLSFVELNMNFPLYQLDELKKEKKVLQDAMEEGLFFTLHIDENISVCDVNPLVRQAHVQTVRDAIALGKAFSFPVINMHMQKGVYVTLPDRKIYVFDMFRDVYLAHLCAFRELCEQEIGDAPLRICIENTDGFPPFIQEGVELLLESPVFSLTLDIGHSHAAQGVDEFFYEKHLQRLEHMHIHDAIGSNNHLVLGTGEIDLEIKLNLACDHHCRCVLETKTVDALQQSVVFLHHFCTA